MKKTNFEPRSDPWVKASSSEAILTIMIMVNHVYSAPDTSELFYPPNTPERWKTDPKENSSRIQGCTTSWEWRRNLNLDFHSFNHRHSGGTHYWPGLGTPQWLVPTQSIDYLSRETSTSEIAFPMTPSAAHKICSGKQEPFSSLVSKEKIIWEQRRSTERDRYGSRLDSTCFQHGLLEEGFPWWLRR